MDIALWIVAALLAAVFAFSGSLKLIQPKDKLYESGMKFVEDFEAHHVKGIGAVEVLGALGLVLPGALDVAPWLTALAATGLAFLMVLAGATHIRRKEPFVINAVLVAAAVFVAIGRFWIEPF